MSNQPKLTHDGVATTLTDGTMALQVDFAELLPRIQHGRLTKELLVKAARITSSNGPEPIAIDATAGLGEDSFLLAAAGFHVRMYEQNATIASLLRDGLARAEGNCALASVVKRMHLLEKDSVAALEHCDTAADVIYLDPMFPSKSKSAATKKKFQLLHALEEPCHNEVELLQAALQAKPQKVVVKRPAKGPHLGSVRPAYSLAGKAVRFDVYTPASMKVKFGVDLK